MTGVAWILLLIGVVFIFYQRAAFPNQPPCEQGRFQEQYHDCAAE